MLKITITVNVSDRSKDSYKDPSGYESIELFCVNDGVAEIDMIANQLTSALLKVAHCKFIAAVDAQSEE